MENIMRPPTVLSLEGNVKENWNRWRQRFENYLIATDLKSKAEERQVAILLHVIGDEAVKAFESFDLTVDEKKKIAVVYKAFENYCAPKTNETVERHIFFMRSQSDGESFSSYFAELKRLSASCGFNDLRDSLIKDKIVCGIKDSNLRTKLLREDQLTLKRCVEICQASELSELQVKTVENESKINAIKYREDKQKVREKNIREKDNDKRGWMEGETKDGGAATGYYRRGGKQYRGFKRQTNGCIRCGQKHQLRECPAYNKICSNCGKLGHFATVCLSKAINMIDIQNESNSDSDENTLFLNSIKENNKNKKVTLDWVEEIKVNKNKTLKVKLDSGAHCNVISAKDLDKIELGKLINKNKIPVNLKAYGGGELKVVGICDLCCKFRNRKEKNLEFIVVNEIDDNTPPTIGLPSLQELNLIKRINMIQVQNKNILQEYGDVFENRGVIKNFEYNINVKENSVGTVATCRKVPIAIRDKLKKELGIMEKKGIIQRVTEPSEWVNPLVIAEKKNKQLRICLDPTDLNKAICRQHYVIPSFEELSAQMPDAKIFTTLDADSGFWQIKLSKRSSKYVTFITPFGRYKFNVMPFGISSATEVFQACFDEIFGDIEGVIILIDDILVWGKNEMEHDERLIQVLNRARERNVTFNKDKCQFRKNEVNYVGHTFSKDGIKVDKNRVRAIVNMPSPKNREELLTFLGMIEYVGKFIPHLSEVSSVLRNLIKKNTVWLWDANAEMAFKNLKELLIKAPILKYFDVRKPVTLSVDASQNGLGAVLLQENLPVAYASKSLTETQRRYAQIEKEALAIAFACSKFRQYCYGKTIQVESDHKPLESLFKKPINLVPPRIQRIRLGMQKYDILVKYKPGKELLLADALSRAYLKDEDHAFEEEIETHVCAIIRNFPITLEKKEEFIEGTNNDPELQILKQYIQNGWPKGRNQVPGEIKQYFAIANELTIIDDLVFKNLQLLIPNKMRAEVLKKLHYNHLGIEKTKNRAREIIYWPLMNKQIEDMITNCDICVKYKKNNVKEPLMPKNIPKAPWEMIGLDFFHFRNAEYLLVVDYFSKYVEIVRMETTTSSKMIEILKNTFSRLGIPHTVCSDNGPQFSSGTFKMFANQWGFRHVTSSPCWPQSNGMSERYVQTIKNILRKVHDNDRDIDIAMLEYRNTPIDRELPSPNEIMFGHKMRGILPILNIQNKRPINFEQIRAHLINKQDQQKRQYDKHAHVLNPLIDKGTVFVNKGKEKPREPGVIVKRCERPRSYEIQMEDGGVIERNRNHIHPINSKDKKVAFSPQSLKESGDHNDHKLEVTPQNNQNDNSNQFKHTVTRSGRVIKPPAYLKQYECS